MGSNISWTLATAVMLATEKIPEASQTMPIKLYG
jgi:hypothetical protein